MFNGNHCLLPLSAAKTERERAMKGAKSIGVVQEPMRKQTVAAQPGQRPGLPKQIRTLHAAPSRVQTNRDVLPVPHVPSSAKKPPRQATSGAVRKEENIVQLDRFPRPITIHDALCVSVDRDLVQLQRWAVRIVVLSDVQHELLGTLIAAHLCQFLWRHISSGAPGTVTLGTPPQADAACVSVRGKEISLPQEGLHCRRLMFLSGIKLEDGREGWEEVCRNRLKGHLFSNLAHASGKDTYSLVL